MTPLDSLFYDIDELSAQPICRSPHSCDQHDRILTSSPLASDSTRVCRFNKFSTQARVTPNTDRVCYWREWSTPSGWARKTAKDFMTTHLSRLGGWWRFYRWLGLTGTTTMGIRRAFVVLSSAPTVTKASNYFYVISVTGRIQIQYSCGDCPLGPVVALKSGAAQLPRP